MPCWVCQHTRPHTPQVQSDPGPPPPASRDWLRSPQALHTVVAPSILCAGQTLPTVVQAPRIAASEPHQSATHNWHAMATAQVPSDDRPPAPAAHPRIGCCSLHKLPQTASEFSHTHGCPKPQRWHRVNDYTPAWQHKRWTSSQGTATAAPAAGQQSCFGVVCLESWQAHAVHASLAGWKHPRMEHL